LATQADASTQSKSDSKVVSTDPPYYDNVPYADLSDFFYVWLRRSLRLAFPEQFATLAVPKKEELVAFGYRHGGKAGAEAFFLAGMTRSMNCLAEQAHPAFPITIYYAFRQSESSSDEGISSTGWETFLGAVIRAGLEISGTWPILRAELPTALAHLQHGNIAPVDLAQAAIGPGMAVYTRYSSVLDATGKSLSVREALTLINQTLDEILAQQDGDFDADTQWAVAWFDQFGFAEGEYGVAEILSKAKNTSVSGMVDAGILASKSGKVRLFKPSELPGTWSPAADLRLTVWEMVHHLIRALEAEGESAASDLAAKLGSRAEVARELAYRLYTVCERKKRAQEALSYNALVQSWPEIARLAREGGTRSQSQSGLFGDTEE
jgi:putative DNA methylase